MAISGPQNGDDLLRKLEECQSELSDLSTIYERSSEIQNLNERVNTLASFITEAKKLEHEQEDILKEIISRTLREGKPTSDSIKRAFRSGELISNIISRYLNGAERQIKDLKREKIEYRYNQSLLHSVLLENQPDFEKALNLWQRFNGLCDILCNYVTQNNIMSDQQKAENFANDLRSENKQKVEKVQDLVDTHLLNINSVKKFFQYIKFVLIGKPPCSCLTTNEQRRIDNEGFKETDMNFLDRVENGTHIKFCVV